PRRAARGNGSSLGIISGDHLWGSSLGIITGSQDAPLMQGVTESMAGRAAVFHLLPLSTRESPKVALLSGGYPESVLRSRAALRDSGR
ncbi:MAG: hypothetical protein SGJ09_00820, partial [Phycisphaerae bacterium]|nr:hypothetical protein [Phycisphaerae bacterium]